MKTFYVLISVRQLVEDSQLDHDDLHDDPKGKYGVVVRATNEDEAKELALDEFHDRIPIAVLDDFDITAEVSTQIESLEGVRLL